MKIIYPDETLQLLAKWDKLLTGIADEYKRLYPPDRYRPDTWYRMMQDDAIYQACIKGKVKVISMSTYTIQLDADEAARLII